MKITRKNFLKLTGSGALAAMLGARPSVAATPRAPERVQPAHRTLIRNADIITLDPKLGELMGADVLIDGGKIAAIGRKLEAGGAEVIDATGMILMPGLIDGHRHVFTSAFIGLVAKISPNVTTLLPWLKRSMVCYTPDDARLVQYAGGVQAIDSGVTSLVDYCHTFHTPELAEQAARGLIESGIAGTFCHTVSSSPTFAPGDTVTPAALEAMRKTPPEEARWQIAHMLREKVFSDSHGLIRFGLSPSGRTGIPMAEVKKEYERVRSFGPHILAIHHHRPTEPVNPEIFTDLWQLGEAGLMGPDFHVTHATGMTDRELQMMRDAGSMICATTMGEHSYPYPSVHGRAQRAGVAVAIGMDAAIAFPHDYFQLIRGAFYNLFRTDEGKAIAYSYQAEDVLNFATGRAARAIREDGIIGTISVGKRADLLLLRTDRLSFPIFGLLAERVVNYASYSDLDSVWIAGVARKRHGRLIGIDMAALKQKMNQTATRIAELAATITFT